MLFELLKLSNELRRDTKKCVFVHERKLMGPASISEYFELSEPYAKSVKKIKAYKEETESRLNKFDAYLPSLEKVMDPGCMIEDPHLLLLANEIAKQFLLGDVYYWQGVMYIEGRGYTHKEDVYDALAVLRKPNALTLKDLVKMADFGLYTQNNEAVILDGIAYVARTYKRFSERSAVETMSLPFIGYLHNGDLRWAEMNMSEFEVTSTDNDKQISVLTKVKNEIDSVIRGELVRGVSLKYKKYPYPIAVLEDGELSYLVTIKR